MLLTRRLLFSLPSRSLSSASTFFPSPQFIDALTSLSSLHSATSSPSSFGSPSPSPLPSTPAPTAARNLVSSYTSLSTSEKNQFLTRLSSTFSLDNSKLTSLLSSYTSMDTTSNLLLSRYASKLRAACVPRHESVFSAVLSHGPSDGMAFIVDLRADLIRHIAAESSPSSSSSPETVASLRSLNASLRQLLSSWFSPGMLELRRITYEGSSAAIVEKIAFEEAVHPIRSLKDLRCRLGNGRRCFGFFHPSLPNEPLVFVHVALMPSLTRTMSEINFSPEALTPPDESLATSAIFYSINSTQTGLAGVDLGNALIKRVASQLHSTLPNLTVFSTLSPVPGFGKWLRVRAGGGLDGTKFEASEEEIFGGLGEDFGAFAGAKKVRWWRRGSFSRRFWRKGFLKLVSSSWFPFLLSSPLFLVHGIILSLHPLTLPSILIFSLFSIACSFPTLQGTRVKALLSILENDDSAATPWHESEETAAALEPVLTRLVARFLCVEKHRGRPVDGVAKFHLGNGAELHRVSFLADPSAKRMRQSYGVMVNYLYGGEEDVMGNVGRFQEGEVVRSGEVDGFLGN